MASFSQNDVPMSDLFELGRPQLSVVSIRGIDKDLKSAIYGTGSLISSRVVLTCAHVAIPLEGGIGFVRLVNQKGAFEDISIEKILYNPMFDNPLEKSKYDVGLIVLSSEVDLETYPSLPMNLSDNLESHLRGETEIYSFSPSHGKLNSNVILNEKSPLRRGSIIKLNGIEEKSKYKDCLFSSFYDYKGFVVIQNAREEETLSNWLASDDFDQKTKNYIGDMLTSRAFIKKITCGETLQQELEKIKELDNLNVDSILKKINSFTQGNGANKVKYSFNKGAFSFYFYPPLSRLSAFSYKGGSGGPCLYCSYKLYKPTCL